MTERGGEHVLTVWTVFFNPADYPGQFVLRGFDIVRGSAEPIARMQCVVENSLEAIRRHIPSGLVPLVRDPGDPASVVESWI